MVNCNHINELDVRFLNFLIRTSVAQVMGLFSLDSAARPVQLGQFRSARLGLTTCDLQLRKVITSLPELRFRCSWII